MKKIIIFTQLLLATLCFGATTRQFDVPVYFTDNVYFNGDLFSDLIPPGNALSVQSGTIFPNQSYAFPQDVIVLGDVDVSGLTTFTDQVTLGDTTINGALTVSNAVTITGTLNGSSTTTIGLLTASNTTINGNLDMTDGAVSNVNTLTVTDQVTLGDTTINGNLDMTDGAITNVNTLTVTDQVIFTGQHPSPLIKVGMGVTPITPKFQFQTTTGTAQVYMANTTLKLVGAQTNYLTGITHIDAPVIIGSNTTITGTNIIFSNLPTSTNGLVAGTLWDDGGTLMIKQ